MRAMSGHDKVSLRSLRLIDDFLPSQSDLAVPNSSYQRPAFLSIQSFVQLRFSATARWVASALTAL